MADGRHIHFSYNFTTVCTIWAKYEDTKPDHNGRPTLKISSFEVKDGEWICTETLRTRILQSVARGGGLSSRRAGRHIPCISVDVRRGHNQQQPLQQSCFNVLTSNHLASLATRTECSAWNWCNNYVYLDYLFVCPGRQFTIASLPGGFTPVSCRPLRG